MLTVYVDSKMAWCTVIGGFVANILLGGLAKSYGLIMEAFQEVFQSGTAYLLLAGGLIYTLMFCLSLVVHFICERYGSRPVIFTGALGSCISLLVAAYSPNIALWVVAIGLGVGASLSCIYFTVFAVVGRCFKRYLGLANGINVAGVSVGQMAFPSLITYLNINYGTRASTVIMSAICLHLIITAVLMPRHIIDPDAPQVEEEKCTESNKKKSLSKKRKAIRFKKVANTKNNDLSSAGDLLDGSLVTDKKLNTPLDEFYSELDSSNNKDKPVVDTPKVSVCEPSTMSILSHSSVSLSTKNARKLTRALLITYIVAKCFGDIGDVSVSFIAPGHGTNLGFDHVTISRAIAVAGAVDLITRLGVGWLTDKPSCYGHRGLLLAFTWLLEGANALAFSHLNYFKPKDLYNEVLVSDTSNNLPTGLTVCYYICFAIHGVCSGTAMTQMIVVLSDWVGSNQLAFSLAVTMVVLGLLISPGQFLIGYLADWTGDYIWPMRVCGIILFLAGFILLLEFPIRRFYSTNSPDLLMSHIESKVNEKMENGQLKHKLSSNDLNNLEDKWHTTQSDSDEDEHHRIDKINPLNSLTLIQSGLGSSILRESLSKSLNHLHPAHAEVAV